MNCEPTTVNGHFAYLTLTLFKHYSIAMNTPDFQNKQNIKSVPLLNKSFESFNRATLSFERYYHRLEQRVKELDIELQNKNNELNRNLKQKEEAGNYLHNILASLTTGVVVIDLDGKITTINQQIENITGLPANEIIGEKFDDIFEVDFFHNLHLSYKFLKDLKGSREFETAITQRERSTININISVSPVKNSDGNKTGVVLALTDITRMKKLEEQANRTCQLAAMGEMAVKIAHEIRNPLGSIELFATTLIKDLKDSEDLKSLAEHISTGVESINNIISNLLLFIKPEQTANFNLIDIHVPLNDSLFFSGHIFKTCNNIEVINNFIEMPLMVNADLELLKQVFLNIILNSIQAMPNGGSLNISTGKVNAATLLTNLAEIKFVDTGNGISRNNIKKIFNPFFTTKSRGTGLGLAIVHNIIGLHGGNIEINSREGKGTVCTITLPLRGESDTP